MDNTLYDFSAVQEAACRAVIRVIGMGDEQSLIRTFLFSSHGVESHDAIREYLSDLSINDETTITSACHQYEQTKINSLIPFPGVVESIIHIYNAGIRIGAVTNASSDHARDRLMRIGLQAYVPILASPDLSGLKKPNPAMYQKAADEMGLPASSICVVGDNLVNDITPAQTLGMFAVYAHYGDRLPVEFAGDAIPDAIIESFSGIIDILGLSL
ncbi:MAG: HAD family hydrolase [Methanobacteriota archaeon]